MTADTWQGIAAEEEDAQLTGGLSALLRRRARHLLTGLLRPHRKAMTLAFLLVVTANLAALAGPGWWGWRSTRASPRSCTAVPSGRWR